MEKKRSNLMMFLPIVALAILILILPTASADSIWNRLIKSEGVWHVFSFLFFFAVVYFALKKIIFGEEKAIAGVVAGIISLFITSTFVDYTRDFLTKYNIAQYVFFGGAILGLIVLAQLVLKIGTLKLKIFAIVYFVAWALFRFTSIVPLEFKNSISNNVMWIINFVGIISGLIFGANLWRFISDTLKGKTPAEKEDWAKRKREEAERNRAKAQTKAAEAKAKAEQSKATRLALERQKKLEFEKKALQRYAKIAERKKRELDKTKLGKGKKKLYGPKGEEL